MSQDFNPGDFIVKSGLSPEEVARLYIFLRVFMTRTMGAGKTPTAMKLEMFRRHMLMELKDLHDNGAYERDLADHFGVSVRTIVYWLAAIRDDDDAILSLKPQPKVIERYARKCMGQLDG